MKPCFFPLPALFLLMGFTISTSLHAQSTEPGAEMPPVYKMYCLSCHGEHFTGGDPKLLEGRKAKVAAKRPAKLGQQQLLHVLYPGKNSIEGHGIGPLLSPGEIAALTRYVEDQGRAPAATATPTPARKK